MSLATCPVCHLGQDADMARAELGSPASSEHAPSVQAPGKQPSAPSAAAGLCWSPVRPSLKAPPANQHQPCNFTNGNQRIQTPTGHGQGHRTGKALSHRAPANASFWALSCPVPLQTNSDFQILLGFIRSLVHSFTERLLCVVLRPNKEQAQALARLSCSL